MYASVQIPLHAAENVLTVPIQAVQAAGDGKGNRPGRKQPEQLEKRDVTLGLQMATEVEILSGLQEGESVVFGTQSSVSGPANWSHRKSWCHPPQK